jgi:hypothetical protein
LDDDDDGADGRITPATEVPNPGAMNLLFGSHSHTDKHSILAAVPLRSIVDRLISKYFRSMDLVPGMSFWLANYIPTLTEIVVVHSPTFLKEVRTYYAAFHCPVIQTFSSLPFPSTVLNLVSMNNSGTTLWRLQTCGLAFCSL